MKKALVPILSAIILLAGFSIFWITGRTGVTDGAALVPAQTVFFATLPDLPRAALRWDSTALAKISTEPEVQAFLEKPLAALGGSPEGSEVKTLLTNLRPGRIFFAIPSSEGTSVQTLFGFQFWGDTSSYSAVMTRLRRQLAGGQDPVTQKETYNGTEIESSPMGRGETLYSAATGHWGLLSNDPQTLRDAINRASGRYPSPSLANDPDFHEALAKLDAEPDFLAFLRPAAAIDFLVRIGNQLGAQSDPGQVESARKARSISYSVRLDGLILRDSLFVAVPGTEPGAALSHDTLRLTTPATLAYFHFVLQPKNLPDLLAASGAAAQLGPLAERILPAIEKSAAVLGNEGGLALAWPDDSMLPRGVGGLTIKDKPAAEAMLNDFRDLVPGMTTSDVSGLTVYSIPALRTAFTDPGITFTPNLAAIASTTDQLVAVLGPGAGPDIRANPAFASALPAFESANETFGFIDARATFDRAFPMLRQVLVFGSSLIPGASDLIDPDKIPATESIARHLVPLIYSQSRISGGTLIQSSGPITMNQAAVLTAIASSSALAPGFLPR